VTDPLAAALALVGDRWTFLVVRELGLGADRFETLLGRTGAPRAVLAGRLRELTAHGLVATLDYQEPRRRTRQRYVLTDSGRALRPVLAALAAWGEDHTPSSATTVDRHRGCGGEVRPRLVCDCGALVDVPTDVLTEIHLPSQTGTAQP
jgi:DNA-binding HxlR family transcriptional regulator